MKAIKQVLYVATALQLLLLAACSKDGGEQPTTKSITFALRGDISFSNDFGEKSLTADGSEMTDVWVVDYMGGSYHGTTHQGDNSASDFGAPTLSLDYGDHTLYFIASRGTSPSLNTTSHTISFASTKDVFWTAYTLTVGATSSASYAVSLDRVVTKLKMTVTDSLPAALATVTLAPATWYTTMDYLTGLPVSTTAQPTVFNIPSSYIGRTDIAFNVYGFSAATEWQTAVTLTGSDANGSTLGTVTVTVPLLRNRVTQFSGPLFSSEGESTITLDTTWSNPYTGTW